MAKKVLLLYISEHSGHHCASSAIEQAIHQIDPSIQTFNINSFNYTNPILEKVINRAYMSVVKRTPEIWDYLYDNPKVVRRSQRLRAMIHRFNTGKLKSLLDEYRPDAILCTQAFPCGMIADYKRSFGVDVPLVGVLTDYAPHSYWVYANVDTYVVPSEDTGRKLVENGVDPKKIKPFGIPIDPRFSIATDRSVVCKKLGLKDNIPAVLLMGGTQGLGPLSEIARLLDKIDQDIQVMVATGTNKRAFKLLSSKTFNKDFRIYPFAKNIDELMSASNVIITKPGGITTAEALSKGLPMLIVSPLPGQEAMNTRYLLGEQVAIKAESPLDATVLLKELLYNSDKLKHMSARAREISKPESAMNIARHVVEDIL